MDRKIMMMAIGVAGVLLTAGLLVAVWPYLDDDHAKKDSKITMPENETVQMGTAKVIDGQLSDQDGKALASETVSIDATLPDGSSGGRSTVSTDDQGKFSFAITPAMAGQYSVSVNFGGNSDCEPSTYTVFIVVNIVVGPTNRTSTTLSMNGAGTVSVGSVENITGLLETEDGAAISWAAVSIQVTNPDGSKRAPSTVTTGTDGKFSLAITPETIGDYIVTASYDGNEVYLPSTASFSFRAGEEPTPPPPIQDEPRLNIAYISGTWGNTVRYGMPEQRSGPYPWNDYQNPGANEFRIESNGYGPDQPEGPVEIATFIKISSIGPRWVGATEVPEGTVEVRTFPPDATTPRLVNLFATADGGCQGILVNDWSVFDYTWVYEEGVTDNHQLTFSLDITKLGDYTVTIWEVHDHRDGNAVRVSNEISWKVHVDGSNICSNSFSPSWIDYTNGTANTVTATVQRGTEPDDDNVNVRNTIAYTGTVHNYLLVSGPVTIKINGVVQTGTTLSDGYVRYDLGTFDFSDMTSKAYTFSITADDGRNHYMRIQSVDVATGQTLGDGYGYLWHPYW